MKLGIITGSEKELLNKIKEANHDDHILWKIPNLFIPLFSITMSILCYFLFGHNRWGWENILYLNLIINGSIPLIAINQISGIGLHIFKFDKSREVELGMSNTSILRIKLLYISLAILALGIILFSYQVTWAPFDDETTLVILALISIGLLAYSSSTARKLYMLQEQFIDKTYMQQIKEEGEKKIGKEWDND